MTGEPQRRPKPVTRDDAEEVAREFHRAYERLAPAHGYETREASAKPWSQVPENNRNLMTATAYDLLDRGEIVSFDHDEALAVVELLSNLGVEVDSMPERLPLVANFRQPLLRAFRKLAFANGRHYGLTNFDMGIEEEAA